MAKMGRPNVMGAELLSDQKRLIMLNEMRRNALMLLDEHEGVKMNVTMNKEKCKKLPTMKSLDK